MLTLWEEEHISLKLLLVFHLGVGDWYTRWCSILDIFLLEPFDCNVFLDLLQCLDIPVSSVGPKHELTFSPLGEVKLASKLSAMACTRPISDYWIPVNCVLFDPATALIAIVHNLSNRYQDHEIIAQGFSCKGSTKSNLKWFS